uniref:Glycosyltransferase n=1 Tax=Kalanchoe fedtschenkoi TaxID=63787 RepID=A0A7N0TVD4_KALFE
MYSESPPLRVFVFPFMAPGHMIPMVDMARLLGSHGVRSTVVTTPVNETHLSKTIENARSAGVDVDVKTIPFPAAEAGLPDGCESIDMLPSPDLFLQFYRATNLLRGPLEQLLEEEKPDCLIADTFLPWTADSAEKLDVPRILFNGTSFFAMCAMESIRVCKPHKSVSSDSEPFVIPNLPDEIWMTRTQFLAELWDNEEEGLGKMVADMIDSALKSFGTVVNSFKELEPAYVDLYRSVMNRRAWHVGPVSLCYRNVQEKGTRGKVAAIGDSECLKWLDSKRPDSVVYLCFGSGVNFPDAQLRDIASGLEDSGQNFIWVIRRGSGGDSTDYLPEGFEERVRGRGLLIRGWAPQVLILDHPSVGGFVTHCGWNSVLEGVSAGLPMVTWPLSAEQFFNEKLITGVLKTGVGVGTTKWSRNGEDHMRSDQVEKAVRLLMEGEDAEERRRRARQLGRTAKLAVEKDGSSYEDLENLLADLKSRRH